jgi:transcriptional regulator with XRE-family HTH domain
MSLSLSEAFGRAARELRRERGLSQEETALAVGIDRAYYSQIERAENSATIKTIARVAAALDVKPSEIFARAEEMLTAHGTPDSPRN